MNEKHTFGRLMLFSAIVSVLFILGDSTWKTKVLYLLFYLVRARWWIISIRNM